jgi:hypothetical protein
MEGIFLTGGLSMIQEIKEKLGTGVISCEAAARQLETAIEAEYNKADADVDYINACEDLLLEIRNGGEWPAFPSAQRYAAEMQKHMRVKKKAVFLPEVAWRCAAVLAVVLVALFAWGSRVLRWQWYTETSTEDEQQFVIRGHEVVVSMFPPSEAEYHSDQVINTKDWDEVTAFLGFAPELPQIGSLGFEPLMYGAGIDPAAAMLYVCYQSQWDPERHLIYGIHYVTDVAEAYFTFEQNEHGEYCSIGGHKVYCAQNINDPVFVWTEEGREGFHFLSGDITFEEGQQIIEIFSERGKEE